MQLCFFIFVGSRQRYVQLLQNQKTSVLKQIKVLKTTIPDNYKLLTVYMLKNKANPNKIDDR